MGTVVGIDPGQSGGIAVLSEGLSPLAFKMPATDRDLCDLLSGLERGANGFTAYIEKVGPMPRQGLSSTWKFAEHYGGLRMALIALGISFEAVPPGVWQRTMGCLSKGDKNVTKRRAQELFAGIKVTHATADALLIAEYGRRRQVNGGP